MDETKFPFNVRYNPHPLSAILQSKTCQFMVSGGKTGFERPRRTVLGLCCGVCQDAANDKKALRDISKMVILGDDCETTIGKQFKTKSSLAELQQEQQGRSYASEAQSRQFLNESLRSKQAVQRQFEKSFERILLEV